MRVKLTIILLAIGAVFISSAIAAGDAAKGKALYAVCIACHGANGEGNKALGGPKLAGQEGWYIVRQLKNFKEGIRGSNPKDTYGQQMRPMAMTLVNEQAMQDVAAYIEAFPVK